MIIAGSRGITDAMTVSRAVAESSFLGDITEIVSGDAQGVDNLAEPIARSMEADLTIMPANWRLYGKSAGPIRNKRMAEYADALIAVWDGESVGTRHMISIAKKHGLKVFVYNLKEQGQK